MVRQPVGKKWFVAAAIFWGGLVFCLSLIPSPPTIDVSFPFVDKLEHAAALAVFTLVVGRSFEVGTFGGNPWLRAFWCAILYGAAIEVAQWLFTTSRSAEWLDLAADAFGAGVVALFLGCRRKRNLPAS